MSFVFLFVCFFFLPRDKIPYHTVFSFSQPWKWKQHCYSITFITKNFFFFLKALYSFLNTQMERIGTCHALPVLLLCPLLYPLRTRASKKFFFFSEMFTLHSKGNFDYITLYYFKYSFHGCSAFNNNHKKMIGQPATFPGTPRRTHVSWKILKGIDSAVYLNLLLEMNLKCWNTYYKNCRYDWL